MTMGHVASIAGVLALIVAPCVRAIEIAPIEATMIADGNTAPGLYGSDPSNFRAIDGRVYFAASTLDGGRELYRTDATPGGLQRVADLAPGRASSDPLPLGAAGGRIVVAASDGLRGRQLWAVEPGGAAVRLTDGAYFGLSPQALGSVGDRLFVYDAGRFVTTDGTRAGTVDFGMGFPWTPQRHCVLADAIVMLAGTGNGWTIARSDGTVAGTGAIANLPGGFSPYASTYAHEAGGQCYLLFGGQASGSGGWTLYASDGSAAGTRVVASSATGTPGGLSSLGGTLYVLQRETDRVRLLRRAPGATTFTDAAEIPGAVTAVYEPKLERIGALLGFGAPYAVQPFGTDVGYYVSDGSAAGTRRVFPAQPGDSNFWRSGDTKLGVRGVFLSSPPRAYVDGATGAMTRLSGLPNAFGDGDTVGGIYVYAAIGATGREVWRTDGSADGAALLHDIWLSTGDGVSPSNPAGIAVGNVVYSVTGSVGAYGADFTTTVLRSDGTAAGTWRLPDGAHPAGIVAAIAPLGDGIAFRLIDASAPSVATWYRADAALTQAVALTVPLDGSPVAMAAGTGVIFGCGFPQVGTPDLCFANASGGHANVLFPSLPGVRGLVPIGNLGGVAVFDAGSAVWRSDGTLPGTFRIVDPPAPPSYSQSSRTGVAFGGKLYFGTCPDYVPCVLWSTDGTRAGTTPVATLPGGTDIYAMAALGARFAFTSSNGTYVQLWSSDGTAAGTELLLGFDSDRAPRLAGVGDKAHLLISCGNECETSYFVSDGLPGGVRRVALPGLVDIGELFFTSVADGVAAFACGRVRYDRQVCVVDRDGERAAFLSDLQPGFEAGGPRYVARTPDGLYVALSDGRHGWELWRLRELPDAIFANGFERRGN